MIEEECFSKKKKKKNHHMTAYKEENVESCGPCTSLNLTADPFSTDQVSQPSTRSVCTQTWNCQRLLGCVSTRNVTMTGTEARTFSPL